MRELKQVLLKEWRSGRLSHPSRVRELKQVLLKEWRSGRLSHPSRVRELKLVPSGAAAVCRCRTPPGCVN